MAILILFLILAVITLIVSVLYQPSPQASKIKEGEEKQQELLEKNIKKLKAQVGLLEAELKKEKDGARRLKEDLEKAIQREVALLNEKNREVIEQETLENTKKELSQLKHKLSDKDKTLDVEYSLNLKLKKELEEKKNEIDILKNDSRRLTDYARKIELEGERLREKISSQEKAIAHLEKKDDESNWISKNEYFRLDKELVKKNEEIEKLHLELAKLKEGKGKF